MHLNSRLSLKRIIPGTYPGLASPSCHGYPSGSHLKVLGQNLLVGIQTSAFPELQTLGLSGVIRGEVSKCFQVLLVPPPSRNTQEGQGRDTEGADLVPSQSYFGSHLLAPIYWQLGWKAAARAGLLFTCSESSHHAACPAVPEGCSRLLGEGAQTQHCECWGSQTQLRS